MKKGLKPPMIGPITPLRLLEAWKPPEFPTSGTPADWQKELPAMSARFRILIRFSDENASDFGDSQLACELLSARLTAIDALQCCQYMKKTLVKMRRTGVHPDSLQLFNEQKEKIVRYCDSLASALKDILLLYAEALRNSVAVSGSKPSPA